MHLIELIKILKYSRTQLISFINTFIGKSLSISTLFVDILANPLFLPIFLSSQALPLTLLPYPCLLYQLLLQKQSNIGIVVFPLFLQFHHSVYSFLSVQKVSLINNLALLVLRTVIFLECEKLSNIIGLLFFRRRATDVGSQERFTMIDFLQFAEIFFELFAEIAAEIAFILILEFSFCKSNGFRVGDAT